MKYHKENFNPSYIGRRDDISTLIPDNVSKVLDVGCSVGTLGEQIKRRNNTAQIVGIEINEQMAKVADQKLDKVIVENVEEINLAEYFPPNYFDCILFADSLEHLKSPRSVLEKVTGFLSDAGIVIASIPNIRHYTTIVNLLFSGYWPYRERGIHDKTHLRFFTLKNIRELFQNAGLRIIELRRNYRIIERPHSYNKFAKYLGVPPLREFFVFQYLVVARSLEETLRKR